MKIKIYYRRNLKISPEKLAAACSHVCFQLGYNFQGNQTPLENVIVVLKASDKKFYEIINDTVKRKDVTNYHLHTDIGLTEVDACTDIAFGWVEK